MDTSDDGDDMDGNTTNDPTVVNVVAPPLIDLARFDFYNLTTGSITNTKVLASQTVTFTAVINDTTINSPTLNINWFSEITTTTAAINLYERIEPNLKIASNNSNAWFYSWTVSPGLVSQRLSDYGSTGLSAVIITATVSGTNQFGVPTSALASRTFSVGASRIYFENNTCKCEGVSAGATAT